MGGTSPARLIVGNVGDEVLLRTILRRHAIEMHFAGSIVVPESIADPLGYYHNNTVKSRALIAATVEAGGTGDQGKRAHPVLPGSFQFSQMPATPNGWRSFMAMG